MKLLGFEIVWCKKEADYVDDDLEDLIDQVGLDLDSALHIYSELLDNNCRDQMAMSAASERIADLTEKYHDLKLEKLESMVTRDR